MSKFRLENLPWWSDCVALKDVLSLRELAERFGASPSAISNALKRNGLDRVSSPSGPRVRRSAELKAAVALAATDTPAKSRQPKPPSKIAPFQELLGKLTDREVAKLAGVSKDAVTQYRRGLGIRSEWGKTAPAKTCNKVGFAYTVTVILNGGSKTYGVVGADIAEASTRALAAISGKMPSADIEKIELIGSAISS